MCVSSRISHAHWALFSLGPYFLVALIHHGTLQEMGLPFLGPRTWIRQAHFTGPVRLHFYPFQLHPSPLLIRRYLRKGANCGDG